MGALALAGGAGAFAYLQWQKEKAKVTPTPVIPDPPTAAKLGGRTAGEAGGKTAGKGGKGEGASLEGEKGGGASEGAETGAAPELGPGGVSTDMRVAEAFQKEKESAEKDALDRKASQAEQETDPMPLSSGDNPQPSLPPPEEPAVDSSVSTPASVTHGVAEPASPETAHPTAAADSSLSEPLPQPSPEPETEAEPSVPRSVSEAVSGAVSAVQEEIDTLAGAASEAASSAAAGAEKAMGAVVGGMVSVGEMLVEAVKSAEARQASKDAAEFQEQLKELQVRIQGDLRAHNLFSSSSVARRTKRVSGRPDTAHSCSRCPKAAEFQEHLKELQVHAQGDPRAHNFTFFFQLGESTGKLGGGPAGPVPCLPVGISYSSHSRLPSPSPLPPPLLTPLSPPPPLPMFSPSSPFLHPAGQA